MNLYNELQINVNSTLEEIRRKYRELAQIHHPDKGGDEEKFKKIKLAYEILSDPYRRKQYDETGKIQDDISLRTQSLEQIFSILNGIVPNFNTESDNLIIIVKEHLKKMKVDLNHDITVCNKFLENLNRLKEKIIFKNEGAEDVIGNFISRSIDQRNQELSHIKKRIEICTLSLEILKDYHYGLLTIENNP